ncbi:hypothetical protein [Streptomyces sp. NPDC088847]|uniref:hypothetical protein n=1 Tax=Streptomyces sp. NPDC088847 TaxID=3365909 RepID=UPI0037F93FEF
MNWTRSLPDYRHRFDRVELRRHMRNCVRGLLASVARKNSWPNRPAAPLDCISSEDRGESPTTSGTTGLADKLGEGDCILIVYDTEFIKVGWYRHMALAVLEHAFLAVTAHQPWEKAADRWDGQRHRLTVAELRRLLAVHRAKPPHLSGP